MKLWIKDPKSGEPSVTVTTFIAGFAVATLKLLVSGLSVGTFSIGAFSGSDYAMVVGALGAIYAARKHTDKE